MSPTNVLRLTGRRVLNPQSILPKPTTTTTSTIRQFSLTAKAFYPRKDSQDKHSIDTEATEYSKSGTDDAAARQSEAAFDPSTTDPQEEKKIAGDGNEVSNEK